MKKRKALRRWLLAETKYAEGGQCRFESKKKHSYEMTYKV